jgi:hypothetical protein
VIGKVFKHAILPLISCDWLILFHQIFQLRYCRTYFLIHQIISNFFTWSKIYPPSWPSFFGEFGRCESRFSNFPIFQFFNFWMIFVTFPLL